MIAIWIKMTREVSHIKQSARLKTKNGQRISSWMNSGFAAIYIFGLAILIITVSILGNPLMVQAEETLLSIIDANNQLIMTDPPPIIMENCILVPISTLADSLEAEVVWDIEQQTVTVNKGNDSLRMRIDSDQAKMNGQAFFMEGAVCNVDDRVYVPLVSVAEALGAKLEWNDETGTVKLLPGMGSTSGTKPANFPIKEATGSQTLTVKAGYFGTPYNTIKVFSLSDLEAMPQVQQAYTFIDIMPSVVLDSAQGVKLTDILLNAGIDIHSIDTIYFYTTDVGKSWYQSLPKSYLLDTKRYYYPNLPTHWDYDKQVALPGAEDGAIEVDTIIAIKDNWKRFATEPDFTQMNRDGCFRLLFGQVDTHTDTAMRSAKWIREISVMLIGQPPSEVTLNQNTAHALVGSTIQLEATVGPSDAANKSVTWSSSNPEVATVDQNGLVSVIGPGTATITVTTVEGGLTASCIINGPDQSAGSQEGTLTGSGLANEEEQEAFAETDGQQSLAKKGSATVSKKFGKIYEMSAGMVPLQPQSEHGNLNIPAGVTSLLLFFLGAGRKYTEYKKEVAE